MSLQNTSHDVTLDSGPASMNDPNFEDAGLATLFDVFFDDAWDLFGREGVEIDGIFDRKNNRFAKRRISIRRRSF